MKTYTRIAALAGVLFIFVANFVFASGQEESTSRTLEVAVAGEPDTLDPQATSGTLTFQVLRNVHDTLVVPTD